MADLNKFLLRLFFWTSWPFGTAMGLMLAIAWLSQYAITGQGGIVSALRNGLGFAILSGLLFGSLMTAILGGLQLLAVKRLGYRVTDETLSVIQQRELTIPLPFDETFTLCAHAIRYLGDTDIEEETDYGSGVILARKGWRWSGAGADLRFDLSADADGTHVVIRSSPRIRHALVDEGTSLKNMDAIVGFLLAYSANQVRGLSHRNPSAHVQLLPADDATCRRNEDVAGLGDSPHE